jgi:glycosyltransferase involved in cell wall biosynthesis
MKILKYTGLLDKNSISGEVVVVKNDMKSLILDGHNVIWLDLSRFNNGLINRLLRPIRLFMFPHEVLYIRNKIKSYKPDVIHLHTAAPYISLSLLFYLAYINTPVVQTLHNVRWICIEGAYYRKGVYCNKCSGNNGFFGVIHKCNKSRFRSLALFLFNKIALFNGFIFKKISCFIPVSDFVQSEHLSIGFPSSKLTVKPNSIDLENLPNISTKDCKRKGVVFASRISKSKGSDILKFVMKEIRDPIYIIGNGPELTNLQKYCDNNQYKHVHFLGKVSQEECLAYMSSALCTLVPSQCGESFSLVAAESMSLGTPVIGSDIGGLASLLKNSEAGVSVRSDCAKEFVDAISDLKCNKLKHDLLSKNGKEYTYKKLNLKKNSLALIDIYRNSLENKS